MKDKDIEDLKRRINQYFSDTRRPVSQTREGLEELQEEIETLLSAI